MSGPNYTQGLMESKRDKAAQLFKINHLSGKKLKDRLDEVKCLLTIHTRSLNDTRYHYHEAIEHLAFLRNTINPLEFKEYEKTYYAIKDFETRAGMLDDIVYELKVMGFEYIRLENALTEMYTRELEQTEIKLKEK